MVDHGVEGDDLVVARLGVLEKRREPDE